MPVTDTTTQEIQNPIPPEEWADVPIAALKGRYRVSSHGRVLSLQLNGKPRKIPKPLKFLHTRDLTVCRMYDASKKTYYISVGRLGLCTESPSCTKGIAGHHGT